MGNNYSLTIGIIIEPFIRLTVLFESILVKLKNKKIRFIYLVHSIIQITYSLFITITSGCLIGFIAFIVVNLRYHTIEAVENMFYSVFWFCIFIFILLIWPIIMNYKNLEYSLPKSLFSIYWLILNMDFKKRLIESVISVLIMPIILGSFLLMFLYNYDIPEQEIYIIVAVVFTICLFISLFIYSESTQDKLKRLSRQCIMWLMIFAGFSGLSMYQIYDSVLQGYAEEHLTSFCITVLGMALAMATIIDKARSYYEELCKVDNEYVTEIMSCLMIGYSIERMVELYNDKKENFIEAKNILIARWKKGKRMSVIMYFTISLAFVIGYSILLFKNENIIDKSMNRFGETISSIWVQIWGGNEELSVKIFVLLIGGFFLIKSLFDLFTKFTCSTLYTKFIFIGRTLIFLLFVMMVLGTIFCSFFEVFAIHLFFPLTGSIAIISIVLYIIEKIEERK